MSALSDYLENALCNWFRGTAFPTPPANVYVALYTTPTDDASGGTEVTGGSYARKAVAANTTEWVAPSGGATSNVNAITFVTATADWGTVTHAALYDASSGGNRLMHGALSQSRTVSSGATLTIPAGDLDLTFA